MSLAELGAALAIGLLLGAITGMPPSPSHSSGSLELSFADGHEHEHEHEHG